MSQIVASMVEFGFTNPTLLDSEGGIIAGHGRVMAAKEIGLAAVPCIVLAHLTIGPPDRRPGPPRLPFDRGRLSTHREQESRGSRARLKDRLTRSAEPRSSGSAQRSAKPARSHPGHAAEVCGEMALA